MSTKTWLVLDVNYLAWRAFHTTGGMSHRGNPTGITFGVLKTVQQLTELHGTGRVVFCFDKGRGLRKSLYPRYKLKDELSKEKEDLILDVRKQIDLLRTRYLPTLGNQNVFCQDGYEGDDIVASVAKATDKKDEVIIVSADKDLYQLINYRTSIYSPVMKLFHTWDWYTKEYHGIRPSQWIRVKAIAGCKGDKVPGAGKGIAEKTVAKYLAGLPTPGDTGKRIEKWIKGEQYKINLKLVTVPYPGCQRFVPSDTMIDPAKWRKLTSSLGMRTLKDRPPESRKGFGFK